MTACGWRVRREPRWSSSRPNRNFYDRHFKPAVRRAGLPDETRFHDLRHTCAALLIALGAHPKAIRERLGHSSITVTLDRYGHLFSLLDEALTTRLEDLRQRALADRAQAASRRDGATAARVRTLRGRDVDAAE